MSERPGGLALLHPIFGGWQPNHRSHENPVYYDVKGLVLGTAEGGDSFNSLLSCTVCADSLAMGVSKPPPHNADRDLKDIVEIKPRFNSHGPEFPAPIQFESDSVNGLYQKPLPKAQTLLW